MNKKKDKKLISHKKIRIRNIEVGDLNDYDDITFVKQVKGIKKHSDKNVSSKSDLNLKTGRVIEIQSNHKCLVEFEDCSVESCVIGGRLKQYNFSTHALAVVGDLVKVDMLKNKSLRIEEIIPRKNCFSRFSEGGFQKEIPIASNLDLIVITTSWAYPMIKYGLIDRYLCLATKYEITPLVCLNKIDLATDIDFVKEDVAYYEESGIKIILTSCETGLGIEELKNELAGKISLFSGQSGVGKSSIINQLHPGLELKTAEISDFNEKGRHTTTSSTLIKWNFGGYLVDTPGIKTVTLHSTDYESIPNLFPGFDRFNDKCQFRNCTHTHEQQCGVKEAVDALEIPLERYESYLRLLDSLK